uniref:Uncharacterized protein n=1 Tax=Panstrongylus lignarius TaxID=156445 RepID=A0A224XTT0_9HEMI
MIFYLLLNSFLLVLRSPLRCSILINVLQDVFYYQSMWTSSLEVLSELVITFSLRSLKFCFLLANFYILVLVFH